VPLAKNIKSVQNYGPSACPHCGCAPVMEAQHWDGGSSYCIGCVPCAWITIEDYPSEKLVIDAWNKGLAWFCNRGFYA
jgi:hypothetical protein